MYSGIIQYKGVVKAKHEVKNGGARMSIYAPRAVLRKLKDGSSVNVSGVCLTVARHGWRWFEVEVMPQTLRLTTACSWNVGDVVLLEPSLRLGDELGGHLLFGHVDGTARLLRVHDEGIARIWTLEPDCSGPWIAKGSIALDGVSLTIASAEAHTFTVSLTPETLRRTTFTQKRVGDHLNIEKDMLQRYSYGHACESACTSD